MDLDMLRLQAFAEGFFIYNTNKQVKVGGGGGGMVWEHGFCLKNKNLFKNLNSLTSQLSTIYIRTYLG